MSSSPNHNALNDAENVVFKDFLANADTGDEAGLTEGVKLPPGGLSWRLQGCYAIIDNIIENGVFDTILQRSAVVGAQKAYQGQCCNIFIKSLSTFLFLEYIYNFVSL